MRLAWALMRLCVIEAGPFVVAQMGIRPPAPPGVGRIVRVRWQASTRSTAPAAPHRVAPVNRCSRS